MTERTGPSGLDRWIATSKGGRDHNEDAFRVVTWGDELVIAVLDGMGGSAAGEVASWVASESIAGTYPEVRGEGGDVHEALGRALRAASSAIKAEAEGRPERKGMGCTAVLCSIGPSGIAFAHVGDSRLYVLPADGDLEQVTRDHTRVQALVDQGILSAAAARTHPDGHVITRALGRDKDEVDLSGRRMLPLERSTLVACTDGLTGVVPDEIIELAASSLKTKHATIALIDIAVQLETTDNVTVAVVRHGPPRRRMPVARFYEMASEIAGRHLIVPAELVETDLVTDSIGGTAPILSAAGVATSDTDKQSPPPARPDAVRPRSNRFRSTAAIGFLGAALVLVAIMAVRWFQVTGGDAGEGSGETPGAGEDGPANTIEPGRISPVRGGADNSVDEPPHDADVEHGADEEIQQNSSPRRTSDDSGEARREADAEADSGADDADAADESVLDDVGSARGAATADREVGTVLRAGGEGFELRSPDAALQSGGGAGPESEPATIEAGPEPAVAEPSDTANQAPAPSRGAAAAPGTGAGQSTGPDVQEGSSERGAE